VSEGEGLVAKLRRQAAIEDLRQAGWLRTIDWLSQIHSTNDHQRQAALEGTLPALPWLLIADRQTSGRGRKGNAWWSPEGCLMLSLALRIPRLADGQGIQASADEILTRVGQLPLTIGVAVARTVGRFVSRPDLVKAKWPNDVYVGGKKISGILIESFNDDEGQVWIIGIGLNVIAPWKLAAPEMAAKSTSLHLECDPSSLPGLSVESVVVDLMQNIHGTLVAWMQATDFLKSVWPDYCFLTGKQITIGLGLDRICGRCLGIDDWGGLMMLDEDGAYRSVLSGVVERWD
jgi:BirA family biotin operon repressor/biotin-[acetyl-CoA-carboxylase] ligase